MHEVELSGCTRPVNTGTGAGSISLQQVVSGILLQPLGEPRQTSQDPC